MSSRTCLRATTRTHPMRNMRVLEVIHLKNKTAARVTNLFIFSCVKLFFFLLTKRNFFYKVLFYNEEDDELFRYSTAISFNVVLLI